MTELLDRLHRDHGHLVRVLDLFDDLLDRFHEGNEPDYELMCEMLAYMDDYADRHLDGSINISLDGSYASWAGSLLSSESPIALVSEPGDERESAMRLGRIGFDKVVGYLEGGIDSVESGAAALRSSTRLSVEGLILEQTSERPPLILDVREPGELGEGRITGSHNIPLPQLIKRVSELPARENVVCYCAGGYRSAIAASLLRRHGFIDVEDLAGGFEAWEREGAPVIN